MVSQTTFFFLFLSGVVWDFGHRLWLPLSCGGAGTTVAVITALPCAVAPELSIFITFMVAVYVEHLAFYSYETWLSVDKRLDFVCRQTRFKLALACWYASILKCKSMISLCCLSSDSVSVWVRRQCQPDQREECVQKRPRQFKLLALSMLTSC